MEQALGIPIDFNEWLLYFYCSWTIHVICVVKIKAV